MFTYTRRAALLGAAMLPFVGIAHVSAQDLQEVTVGALRFTSHSAGFIAYERGYFEEEGLDVTFEFFQAAQPIAVATAGGDVDFGVAGVTGGLINLAERDAIRIVAGVMSENENVDGMMLMASNQAWEDGVRTPADMAGRSMAMTQIGSSFHYMISHVAEGEGFDIADMNLVPLQGVGNMLGAMRSGQVDTMIMVPHIAKPMVANGEAHQLGWLNAYTDYPISTLFTSVENIENDPDMVQRFVRAYARGIADFNAVMLADDPDPAAVEEMTRLIHNYVYVDREYENAAGPIQAGAMYLNEGAALDVTGVEEHMNWFLGQGLVDSDITLEQLVDDSFVETF